MMDLFKKIVMLGVTDEMSYSRKLKMVVLNHLSFFSLLISSFRFLYIISAGTVEYSTTVKLLNFLPLLFFTVQLLLMSGGKYKTVLYNTLIAAPPMVVLLNNFTRDAGQELFLIIPTILSFYFIKAYRNVMIMFLYDMFWILIYYVHKNDDAVTVTVKDIPLEIINYIGSIVILFLMLYSVKYQVRSYEKYILKINDQLSSVNNVKDKIFAIIAHDLRTPLLSVAHLLNYMQDHDADVPAVISMLPEISSEINNTTNLMNNLLNWSKSHLHEMKPNPGHFTVKDVADEVYLQLKPVHTGKKITVRNDVAADDVVWADAEMITIVLRNLLSNALKFSPENSCVEIYSEKHDGKIKLGIKDYGKGIPNDKKPFIFKSFDHTTRGTANEQGFGLGLLICKELVEANDGTIHFISKDGAGSNFWMELPAEKVMITKVKEPKKIGIKLAGEALRISAF